VRFSLHLQRYEKYPYTQIRVEYSNIVIVVNNSPFNESNFEEVFKTYFGPLCNYVNSYLKDWESSREIVQGTFMKVWENKDTININTSAKSYLYSAVRNRMIDAIRSDKKFSEYKNTVNVSEVDENVEQMNSYVIREEIMKSMDKLKPKMRKIFSLSKIEGLTYNEIAAYLNISKRSVEDNVAKALRILKEDLQDNEIIFSD